MLCSECVIMFSGAKTMEHEQCYFGFEFPKMPITPLLYDNGVNVGFRTGPIDWMFDWAKK